MLFPGSGLFLRKTGEKSGNTNRNRQAPEVKQTPGWIVAAEMVETSRIFARTTARIDPRWIVELGGHLCRTPYAEPHWNAGSGRVLVTETRTLHGLQVSRRMVSYHKVDPKAANEMFIRHALVDDEIRTDHPYTAQKIAAALRPTHTALLASLEAHILDRYGVRIQRSDWREEALPDHLRMRIQVMDKNNNPVMADRDIRAIKAAMEKQASQAKMDAWTEAAGKWERYDIRGWTFGDLPERVGVTQTGGLPLYGYPGLQLDGDILNVRLFRNPEEAERETKKGLLRLYEWTLGEALTWLKHDLQDLAQLPGLAVHAGGSQALQAAAYTHLTTFLFDQDSVFPLTEARGDAIKDRRKAEQVRPFEAALDTLLREETPPGSLRHMQIEAFRWMLEEFRVSVFAQDLGTAYPVSPKRLDRKIAEIDNHKG